MKTMKIYDHQPDVKRTSKKGKVAHLAMTILLAFGIGVYAGTGIGNIGQGPTVAADEADVHVVEDGETLWDIARSVADARGQDIRETIYEIKINNGLQEDDNLQPGQRIIIR
ncbi:LysM peptidoglycan-binding domain-containing protein [Megasphaera sp. WILCCON 0056]|uniref:LysM peptidoglycan-binding domain-containing protein n=1 Tax=Megasphaera sp. WILCCON 0056 TaxID=3345340 RepID=UPI003A7F841D